MNSLPNHSRWQINKLSIPVQVSEVASESLHLPQSHFLQPILVEFFWSLPQLFQRHDDSIGKGCKSHLVIGDCQLQTRAARFDNAVGMDAE